LAQQLKLGIVKSVSQQPLPPYLLCCTANGLQLQSSQVRRQKPVWVDFTRGKAQYRRLTLANQRQLLAQATAVKSNNPAINSPFIIDATAGLGQDSFILACLGCRVHMLERHPVFAALLADGLKRGLANPSVANIVARLSFSLADAIEQLPQPGQTQPRPDIVYLDPMFPSRSKSALVKKQMRIFHELAGADEDQNLLLAGALTVANKRVVVKRPAKAEHLAGIKPSYKLLGKTIRYDVYMSQ
jgi:16S rRNA (guanine1516-N2)-methyltransferase